MALNAWALTTVAEVKTYLTIAVSTYDTLLEDLIDSCSDWIEAMAGGRRFKDIGTDVTQYYDGGERNRERKRIFLKNFPINAFTSVAYSSGPYDALVWTSFSAASDFIRADLRGELYFPGGLPAGVQNIRVVYKGGYTTIPDDLNLACKKLVAKEFNKRKAQGFTNESVGGGSIGWNEKVDPSVRDILNRYRDFQV